MSAHVIITEGYAPAPDSDYTDSVQAWAREQSPHLADMLDMHEPMYDLIGQRHTIRSDSGNFMAQYVEDEDDNLYLIGIVSPTRKLSRTDHADVVSMVELLLSKLATGKTLITTPHEGSMKMLDYVVRRAQRSGMGLDVQKGQRAVFGDSPTLRYQQVEVRAV